MKNKGTQFLAEAARNRCNLCGSHCIICTTQLWRGSGAFL